MNNFATKRTYRSVEAPIVPLMSLSFRSNIQKEKEPHKNAVWHFYKTLNTTGGKDKCSYLQRKKVWHILYQTYAFLMVGSGGFEPSKSLTTDLQSAPFGRSGNSPFWSWWTESNHQPADYKSAALPLSHTSIFHYRAETCLPRDGNEYITLV